MERERPLSKEELINRLQQLNRLINDGLDDEELIEQREDVYSILEDRIDREDKNELKRLRKELNKIETTHEFEPDDVTTKV